MGSPPPLVCAGRPVNDHGQPTGPACGRRFDGPEYVNNGRGGPRTATAADQIEHARAAGWSVAGPPCCPACRKPSAEMTQLAKELRRG